MAMHCAILAWEIPRTEGPGGLYFMGSIRTYQINNNNKLFINFIFLSSFIAKLLNHHCARFLHNSCSIENDDKLDYLF